MIIEMLRQVIGKRLASVGGTFHTYEGRASVDPIAVWLNFAESKLFRLSGASDGWHLVVDDVKPSSIDMQESGSIQFSDMSSNSSISPAIGHEVRHAWLVGSPGPEDAIGVRLDFASCTIRILNWGDELRVASEFPPDADTNEIVECPIEQLVNILPMDDTA